MSEHLSKNLPGKILREAREEKGVSLQKAGEETKITSRHLQALEEDNFSVFPGETYALGFLRKYAVYLDLDPEHLIQLYKGAQLVEKEVPLQELTRPTVSTSDYLQKYLKPVALIFVLALGGILGYQIITDNSDSPGLTTGNSADNNVDIEDFLKKSDNIPEIETEHVKLRAGFTTAVVSADKGIDFSVQNTEIYLIVKKINYRAGSDTRSSATLEMYPGRREFVIEENSSKLIDEENIPRKFRISLTGATPNNVKLQIQMGETTVSTDNSEIIRKEESRIANPSNFILRLRAVTTGENFVEFYKDGKLVKKGPLAPNSQLLIEANNSIQMKLGDAGAIKITINGKPYSFGRRGETAHKIIRKVKDPIEQTKYNIEVKDISPE